MSLEEVEKIMDETADAVEYQRQISDLLGGSLSDEDEADVSCLIIKCSKFNVHGKKIHKIFLFSNLLNLNLIVIFQSSLYVHLCTFFVPFLWVLYLFGTFLHLSLLQLRI